MAFVRHAGPWFAALTVLACAPRPQPAPAPTHTPSPATAPATSSRYPLVRILRDDNFADERSSSSYDIRPDGSFAIEHVMSNGGADATVTACAGRISAYEASEWIARVRSDARLATPPRGPSREDAFARRIRYRYSVGYAPDPQSMTYADPERWIRELESMLERLGESARCKTFTRLD